MIHLLGAVAERARERKKDENRSGGKTIDKRGKFWREKEDGGEFFYMVGCTVITVWIVRYTAVIEGKRGKKSSTYIVAAGIRAQVSTATT